jgi:hypothetical protein
MWDKIKIYCLTTAMDKYLPTFIMSLLAALGAFMLAHAGAFASFGITYSSWPFVWPAGQEPSGPCILIELDSLSTAAIALIVSVVGTLIRAGQHHLSDAATTAKASVAPTGGTK